MSCVHKCDVCGRLEYEVELYEWVDREVWETLLKDWHLSKPLEDICGSCIDRINESFDEPVIKKTKSKTAFLTPNGDKKA